MKKREKKKGETGNWMDTYGDMVTLLLCFFVLMYSISTVDTVKWRNFVKSMNPNAEDQVSQLVLDTDAPPDSEDVPGGSDLDESADREKIDEDFNSLYEDLQEMSKESGGDILVTEGDDFVFIMFRDRVIFEGDSSVLLKEGEKVIDHFAETIKPYKAAIKELQIMGHTTQALPNKKNPIESDRSLSAMRSAKVAIYLQSEGVLEPYKIVSLGYGQHHPIASFKTEKDRSLNRRVEFMISKTGGSVKSLEDYYSQIFSSTLKSESEKASGTKKSSNSKKTNTDTKKSSDAKKAS